MAKFRYLGTKVPYKCLLGEEAKSRLKLGNAHSVQKLLSSHLLSKIINIKFHKTAILPVVLCVCESWLIA